MMVLVLSAAFLLSAAYVLFIVTLYRSWKELPPFTSSLQPSVSTSVSVLLPVRNEAAHICGILKKILSQNYPSHLFELILIDDHSTDSTTDLARSFADARLRLLRLSEYREGKGKKAALALGVRQARGHLVVTTDADCTPGPNWLRELVSFYETTSFRMVAAPVLFHREHGPLERFQSLDYLGMMGFTGAGIQSGCFFLGNGANLAYEKALFEEVGGFSGFRRVVSGDDVLLVQKVEAQQPGSIGFLKSPEAVVYSLPQPNRSSFLQQRLRWASKGRHYRGSSLPLLQALVFVVCASVPVFLLLIPFCGLPALAAAGLVLGAKGAADYFWLRHLAHFFRRSGLLRGFWLNELYHLVYILAVGGGSLLGLSFRWKGRRYVSSTAS